MSATNSTAAGPSASRGRLTPDAVRAEVQRLHIQHAIGSTPADAFAAWWLTRRYDVSARDAAARAPGGSHDFGIDAFHLRATGEAPTLHVIQAKFSTNKSLVRQAVRDFVKALPELRALLDGRSSDAPVRNSLLGTLAAQLERQAGLRPALRVQFEVLHLADQDCDGLDLHLSPAVNELVFAAEGELPDRIVSVRFVYPPAELDAGPPPHLVPSTPQEMRFAGEELRVGDGTRYFAGLGYLADLVELYRLNGEALFSKNVRAYLYRAGDKGPARHIRDTLRAICVPSAARRPTDPEHFALLHNGITLHARSVEQADGRLVMREPSVLNGCQTVKSAALFAEQPAVRDRLDADAWRRVRVPVRVLVTRDEDLVRNVTVSNNRQNNIRPSAFRANDPLQLDLAQRFRVAGIYYERQEQAFEGLRRSQPRLVEEEYAHSRARPIGMEELATAIACVVDRPALSVASKTSDLFEDPVYAQVFAPQRLGRLDRLVFLRNLHAVMPLVLKDLRAGASRALELLSPSRFRFAGVRLLGRYVRLREPGLIAAHGAEVYAHFGVSHPLRVALVKLTHARRSGLQQVLPRVWADPERPDTWRSATDAGCVAAALQELGVTGVDYFAAD